MASYPSFSHHAGLPAGRARPLASLLESCDAQGMSVVALEQCRAAESSTASQQGSGTPSKEP